LKSWCLVFVLLIGLPARAQWPKHMNSAEPSSGHRVIQLEEQWRIGGPDNEENLPGVIDKALTDQEGNLYLLDIQLTEVQVFDPEGQFVRRLGCADGFSRPYTSLKRASEERDWVRESMNPRRRRNRTPPDIVVEPTERDILDMVAMPGGHLWVFTSRGINDQPAGIHSTWDVFAESGIYQETVGQSCEGDGQRDAIIFALDKLVILVKEHTEAMTTFRGQGNREEETSLEATPLEVICYTK